MTIETAKQQITQARSQIAEQRAEVEKQRINAQKKQELLSQAQEKLPSRTSARALRQTMSGLQGRAKRQQIAETEQKILTEKGKVKQFKEGLTEYEKELTQYEDTQIKPVESEIKRVEEYNAAVETIKKAADKGMVWAHAFYGEGLVKELAQDYEKQKNLNRISFEKQVQKFELANPTEKLEVDWKNLQIKGVQSGSLSQTLSVKDYNKKIGDMQFQQSVIEPTKLDGIKSNVLIDKGGNISNEKINQSSFINFGNTSNFGSNISYNGSNLYGTNRSNTGSSSNILSRISNWFGSDSNREANFQATTEQLQNITGKGGQILTIKADPFYSQQTNIVTQVYPPSDKLQGNILTADLGRLKEERMQDLNQYNKLNVEIPKLQKEYQNIVYYEIPRLEKEIGTDPSKYTTQQINQYNKLVEQAQNKYSQYEQRINQREKITSQKTTFGFYNYKKDVPNIELTSPFGYASSQLDTIFEGTGKGAGQLYSSTLSKVKIGKQPEAVLDLNANVFRLSTEKDFNTLGRNVLTSEQVSKGTTGGLKFGAYFTPYLGVTYFSSQMGESLSQVGYSPTRFVKEKPIEALFLGGALVGAGALRGARYARAPIVKETATGFIVTNRWNEFAGKRIRLSKPEKGIGIKTDYLPSQRGKVVEYIKIDKPLTDLKSLETYGRDFGKNVVFPEQQVGQFGFAGRRTKVTKVGTFGREKTLYEGIPYSQRTRYESQLEFFENLFNKKTAQSILRYTAPRAQKEIIKGQLNIKRGIADGAFFSEVRRPKIVINKKLGIKTREGKTDFQAPVIRRVGDSKGQFVELGIGAEGQTLRNMANIKGIDLTLKVGKVSKGSKGKIGDIEVKKLESISVDVPAIGKVKAEAGSTLLLSEVPKEEKILSFMGKGKKSSPEYFQELYSDLKVAPIRTVPKKPQLPGKPVLETPTPKTETPLSMTSPYAGTGLYEKTEDVSVLTMSPQTITMQRQPVLMDSQTSPRQINLISPRSKLDSQVKTELFQPTKELLRQPTKTFSDVKVDTFQKTQPRQRPVQTSITKQTPVQTPVQTSITRPTKPKTPTTPKTPKVTKVQTPFSNIIKSLGKKKEEELEVFGKRFGKDFLLKKVKNKEQAKEILGKFLTGTLGRSGKVKSDGKELSFKELGFGDMFRSAKRDKFRVVQKAKFSLGTSGERSEIQMFKRKKSTKKKKKFSLFG